MIDRECVVTLLLTRALSGEARLSGSHSIDVLSIRWGREALRDLRRLHGVERCERCERFSLSLSLSFQRFEVVFEVRFGNRVERD